MRIEQFNALSDDECRAGLTRCCGATGWVDLMLAARPFVDWIDLYQAAGNLWWTLTPDDWREAFNHHPKIGGDMSQLRQKFASTADWSAGEQAGVGVAREETLQQLAQGNIDYEAHFGYIFIVCATGKSAAEMLDLLQMRLPNEPENEIFLAAEEQCKITSIRLQKWLGAAVVPVRHVALTRLVETDGRVVMQLRDDRDHIVWPNQWSFFGGGLDAGEDSKAGALRELQEELTIAPNPDRFYFRRSFVERQKDEIKMLYIFDYQLRGEMNTAVLREGQRYDRFTPEDVMAGEKDGHLLIAHHRDILLWFKYNI